MAPGSYKLYRYLTCRVFQISFCLESTSNVRATQKESPFPTFTFLLVPRTGKICPEEGLSVFSFFLLHQLILVLQLYFSTHFNDNFSLAVGNLQHADLVTFWLNQKILVKGLDYMADCMPIPYFIQETHLSLHFMMKMRFQPLRKLSSVVTKLFLIQFWNSEGYLEGQIIRFAWALQCSDGIKLLVCVYL